MTSDLDQALADQPIAPPTPGVRTVRRHRHVWEKEKVYSGDHDLWEIEYRCACGKPKDEAASRRGRNARKRGNRIQRERIVALGGRNLAGNNPNLDGLGEMFAYESKSGGAFSARVWRWLTDIPKRGNETGVLIVTEAPGPGRKARSYVVVEYGEWRDLHGEVK